MINEFKAHAENICKCLSEEGIVFRPFSKPQLPYFSSLPPEEQSEALDRLCSYDRICAEMHSQGQSLKNTRLFVQKALDEFGLQVRDGHLDVIENHHLVEFYNLNHVQIFRSFRFFEVSSYTLEDITCRKWWNLYERSPQDEATIQKIAADFVSSSAKTMTRVTMPRHVIREKDTLERLVVQTQLHWLIPLYKGQDYAGIFAIETSDI